MNRIATVDIWLHVLETGTYFGINEGLLNNVRLLEKLGQISAFMIGVIWRGKKKHVGKNILGDHHNDTNWPSNYI